jgi:hypothetical protein
MTPMYDTYVRATALVFHNLMHLTSQFLSRLVTAFLDFLIHEKLPEVGFSQVLHRVRSFIPRYKLHTQIQSYIFRYKTTYTGTKIHIQVQNYIHRCKTTYPGTKLRTQVQNYGHRYKTMYVHTRLQNFLPGPVSEKPNLSCSKPKQTSCRLQRSCPELSSAHPSSGWPLTSGLSTTRLQCRQLHV